MNKSQLQVKEFHEAFGVPVHTTPQVTIAKERALLRANLIFEEAKETIEAMGYYLDGEEMLDVETGQFPLLHVRPDGGSNIVEIADGLADLIYVINGAALEFGIDLEPVLDAVHQNNMDKAWTQDEWNQAVEDGRAELEGLTATSDGKLIPSFCVKRADGKLIKPDGFKKVDIAAVLEKQSNGL